MEYSTPRQVLIELPDNRFKVFFVKEKSLKIFKGKWCYLVNGILFFASVQSHLKSWDFFKIPMKVSMDILHKIQ